MISCPASPLTPDHTTRYYVIIGCGFSGILNHVLLRHPSSTRLVPRPILHIGKPDPWGNYHPMEMGQWPTLLTLPGFTKKPSKLDRHTNLLSNEFAKVNKSEWKQLARKYPFYYKNGHVVAIRASKDRYEVTVDDGETFQADYIDVCGGPGPARRPPTTVDPAARRPPMTVDPTLLREFDGAPGPRRRWPRLVSGQDFLTAKRRAVPDGHHICVYGGGATGAWCVEHAQTLGHTVHWVAEKELNDAFVASRRNDGLLQGRVEREIVEGDQVVKGPLRPARPSTYFGENMVATKITPIAPHEVEITFAPAASATWRLTASTGTIPLGPATVWTLRVQQVVLSIGQETGGKEDHSWTSLLRAVLDNAHLIIDLQDRVVGLRSDDDRIRVLGAAAFSHPDVSAEWTKPGSKSWVFFRSLVEQARVPNGITLSAISLAEANGLWSKPPNDINDNLNTCGLEDLERLTQSWPAGFYAAETWFKTRGHRISPFEKLEFRKLLAGKISY